MNSIVAFIRRIAPALVAFVAVAVIWQMVALNTTRVIPRFSAVASAFNSNGAMLWSDGLRTLREAVVGLGAGFVVAFSLAIAMTEVRILERALMPLAVVLNVTPLIAIAPGLSLAFGFGYNPKYILTAIIVFFPFLVNAAIGLRSVDRETLDVFSSLDASRWEVLWRLRLPSSLPFLFSAARICFPLSIVGAVVAEFTASASTTGLGGAIVNAAQYDELGLQFAEIFCLALMGIVFTVAVALAQRRFLRWHSSARQVLL